MEQQITYSDITYMSELTLDKMDILSRVQFAQHLTFQPKADPSSGGHFALSESTTRRVGDRKLRAH